jgi:hypothetical protein
MKIEHRGDVRPHDTPTPVVVIGWVYVALGVLTASGGIVAGGGVLVLLLLAALLIIVGIGLVYGRLWAYYVAVAMSGFNSITLLVAAIAGTTGLVVPLSINVTVLYWLLRRSVREWAGLTGW